MLRAMVPDVALPESQDATSHAVASTDETGSDVLRSRLAVFAATFTWLSVTGVIACNVVGVAWLDKSWAEQLAHKGNHAGLLASLPLAVVWVVCRFSRPSQALLRVLDFVGTFAFCLGYALVSYYAPSACHPGLDVGAPQSATPPIGVFANMAVLYVRAAIIPGTPLRTLVVSTLSSLPIVLVAHFVRRHDPGLAATSFAWGTTLLSLWVVPGPAIASWVIYHLQREVREARQLGQYTLETRIGAGGMGVVYRARHALLRRPTAIKLLAPGRAGPTDLARFEREVQETSRLTHPNTIAIYDYGRTSDGVFYYAMEYLDGVSLEELVRHDGPQPARRVVHILRQACGALAEAHARGLIHRDVKPANLHLCPRGGSSDHVKVLDFGLVKETKAAREATSLSEPDSFLGTPLYMAPEAIRRSPELDARADLYALGAVAYFLLTGAPPFQAPTLVEVCALHLHSPPRPPSERSSALLPRELEALILRCLAKSPSERPAGALELERELAACLGTGEWTQDDGARWWRERGPTVRDGAFRSRAKVSGSGENTVAVDFRGRTEPRDVGEALNAS